MYTIKQAAQRSGVSVALLRAWERRYGIVEPARTPGGYRLYDDLAITRLRAMRALIDDGWAASTAADEVRRADDEALAQLAARASGKAAAGDAIASASLGPTADTLTAAFVGSAAALDEPGFEAVLDDMFARGSFEHVTTEMVMPSLVAIGEGWAAGSLDVAAEHAAAAAVQRRLGLAFMAAGRPAQEKGLVLVGLPPGARHELGALAFATAARRAGVPVRYLGADLPVENWIDAAVRTQAVAAVIGVVIAADVDAAERVGQALRATRPGMLICFGGPAAELTAEADDGDVLKLPAPLVDAVDALRLALPGLKRPKAATSSRR
jgi:MerR family transcriptional regulator, light-induced transcriptional regulator